MDQYTNFDRQYRMSAGPGGATGFEIGQTSKEQPLALHVDFSFERSDLESHNTGRVNVWNLNKEHLAVLNEKDCILSFRAGYKDRLPLIFAGVVSSVRTTLDYADRKTEIEVVDNLIGLRDTYVTLSYNGKVNWRTILDDVASQIGVVISYSYNAEFVDISNGYSYVGLAKDVLTKGCDCCNLDWSVQNGVLQIKKPDDVMSREVYVLSPETGLLGIPSKIKMEKSTSGSNTDNETLEGWEVEYFLNGAITIDDFVKLESREANGYFRVYSIEHAGDNISGDWTSKAKLYEVV